jgi:hypothetical protein
MGNYTIKISENNTKALALINFLKSLDFIEFIKTENQESELDAKSITSIEKSLNDIKNNHIHNDQDVRNSIRKRILNANKK